MVVVWTSWPQAWVTPWFFEANGRPGFLDDRQGIDVAAQCGGDGALADVHGQAGALEPPRLQAGGFEPFHELVRGAEFLEGQFRVRMQVPAEIDQFRQERLQPRPHQCGGLGFSSVIAHIINSSERPTE